MLVKNPSAVNGPASICYTDIGDYLSREAKLLAVTNARGVRDLTPLTLEPNEHGDWLNQRDERFGSFVPMVGDAAAMLNPDPPMSVGV
ncbi:MAG: hypothetical protein LH477_01885 [Nocardioides sp.]|nr:hypothetical protein [Nocardioides sp.]